MTFWYSTFLLALAIFACGCATHRVGTTPASVGRLDHLGSHTFKITTSSPETQRHFDRGLTLAYAFGHYAAEQEFRKAAAADPNCAMAWWGIALVNGPHINYPVVPATKAATAWEAVSKAIALGPHVGALERELIVALSARYAKPQPEDRGPLDKAYAEAMAEVWRAHPNNADVGTLFAEALMDLHPWDLWKNKAPQPWTPEIVETLERVFLLDSQHPGANHLYVHAIEASPNPEKALVAADRLTTLVPDSSHLVHMPAHIYVRVGQWDDAASANRHAMKADALYRAAYPRPGFYALYMAHNAHFLAYVSMMQARKADTIRLARELVVSIPEEFLKNYPSIADGFMIFVSEALMRFGRWEEILAEPQPRGDLPLSRALWHFTRAAALTALDRSDQANAEKAAFQKAAAAVPKEWTFGNNSASNILAIAAHVLDGEMAAKTGQYDAAIASLRQAMRIEDNLLYDEPPDWILPVRHTLGAVLMTAGRPTEAERVYREDLVNYPENGWALQGLRDALRRQNKDSEAKSVDARLKKIWANADVKPPSSCYCQPGK